MDRTRVQFWSSVGAHPFQRALVERLRDIGIHPTEHCSVSQIEYRSARSRLQRLQLRLRAYAAYPAKVAWHFSRVSPEACAIVSSNTFYAPWIAAKVAGETPVVHWVLDLFPDALVVAGSLREGSTTARVMRWVMRDTFERSAANVFLGRHLLAHAECSFGPIPRAHVIPVGGDGRPFASSPPEPRVAGKCRVMYCGNFGLMHDVDTVAAALTAGVAAGLEFHFYGNGSGMRRMEQCCAGRPGTYVGPNLDDSEWARAMAQADVALVTMRTGAQGVVLPSKAYSALLAGQAVLAICPDDSDLADLVRQHGAGWIIAPGDVEGLRARIALLLREPGEVLARRRNAWEAGHTFYDQKQIAAQWAKLLRDIECGRQSS